MKSNGFTLIEVIVAFSILAMLLVTTLPIMTKVNLEDEILKDRRKVISILHDELLKEINTATPSNNQYTIQDTIVIQIFFEKQEELLKGCAVWKNKKNQTEKVCLYGNPVT